jgi:hypothetical protein
VAGGVVGHRSAVVVDDFDVVPVGVQDERAVVAGVVHGALPRTAVVLVAGGERGGVKRAHRGVLAGGEREVDVLRGRPLVGRARVACRTAEAVGAVGVLCLAFPLVAPSGKSRQEELDGVSVPVLVVQGERDRFGVPARPAGARSP